MSTAAIIISVWVGASITIVAVMYVMAAIEVNKEMKKKIEPQDDLSDLTIDQLINQW